MGYEKQIFTIMKRCVWFGKLSKKQTNVVYFYWRLQKNLTPHNQNKQNSIL